MKAITYTSFGTPDVLQLNQVEKPIPDDNQMLVKVCAASVNYSDWAFVRGKPFLVRLMGAGFLRPKNTILGKDIAGKVEVVGANVKQFNVGDEVFGDLSHHGYSAFAEYVCIPESAVALKPAIATFEQAAAVPEAGVTALRGLRDEGGIREGQKVLVYGASGGIGTFAVQIAKAFNTHVTGVCSTRNLEMVRSIGADHVIDYTREDFVQSGQCYDLILSTAGYRSIFDYRRALCSTGTYVMAGGSLAQILQAGILGPWLSKDGGKSLTNLASQPDQSDLQYLSNLIADGKIMPVIDRSYALIDVADALRYYGQGHARGKVVINVGDCV